MHSNRRRPGAASPPPDQVPGGDDAGSAASDTPTAGSDSGDPGRSGPLVVNTPAGGAHEGPSQGAATPDLRLPHEHDESARDMVTTPDPVIHQAAKDLESGQVDTDLHNIPGVDAERREELLKPVSPTP